MPTVVVNGRETYYADDDFTNPWEDARGTILIQHGIARHTQFWNHWVPALAREYRVIRRDFPGHGSSPDPGTEWDWSAEDQIDDLAGFIAALELQPVHYLGESTGGVFGLALAARRPDLLSTLTTCSAPFQVPLGGTSASGYDDLPAAVRDLGTAGWVKTLIDSRVLSGGTSAEYEEWVLSHARAVPEHVFAGIASGASSLDVEPLLASISVPTLILAPARSPLTPLTDQVKMRNAIPDARIVVAEGPGHEIYVDESDVCLTAFLRFLRSH
jgi:pimeloyl-ACP methyl ester carboxylesterase